jgi:hypothetical protein
MKRLWGLRHLRWLYYTIRVHRFARAWGAIGIGLGVPNEADLRHLQAIWEGRA